MMKYLNSQAEVWKALLDGEAITDDFNSFFYKLVDNVLYRRESTSNTWYPNVGYSFAIEHFDKTYYRIYEKPKWYENIPEQGILCWVWDWDCPERKKHRGIAIISGKESGRFISVYGNSWVNALPLTKEEMLSLLWEEQNI